ncbi:hypothetical protein [Streptomyces niveus]|uniref:hypothetical protein n=1 Tax=Streptomyces niveus TaxID=193462 RepID=UPI00344129CB
MPLPWEPPNGNNIVERYEGGESVNRIAINYGVSPKAVRGYLTRSGASLRVKTQLVLNGVVARHAGGESVKSIADSEGVSRGVVTRILRQHGVEPRGVLEANRLMMEARTVDENRRNSAAAHAAVRGTKKPVELLARMALDRERKGMFGSAYEQRVASWLSDLGPIPQKAIGIYNVDLAIGPVAVEIFGGKWHSFGRHAERTPERARQILDAGWLLVVVWVADEDSLKPDVADYVRTLAQQAEATPALRGEYRVIWGTGEDVTATCANLNQLADIPPTRYRLNRGA